MIIKPYIIRTDFRMYIKYTILGLYVKYWTKSPMNCIDLNWWLMQYLVDFPIILQPS